MPDFRSAERQRHTWGGKGAAGIRYVEQFWEEAPLRFRNAYVGFPALAAERYVLGPELVGMALSLPWPE